MTTGGSDGAGDTDDDLIVAGLSALESFAAALLQHGLPARLHRPVVLLAWETARQGELDDVADEFDAQLSAEEAALAELGAVAVAAALEAAMARGRLAGKRGRSPARRARRDAWQWLRFRVDACGRAAAFAGVAEDKCAGLRQLGYSLIEPFREELEVSPGASGSRRQSPETGRHPPQVAPPPRAADDGAFAAAAAAAELAYLWVLPQESGTWRGPLTSREVLHLVETQELDPEALVFGLDGGPPGGAAAGAGGSRPPVAPSVAEAKPLWESLSLLGKAVRRDSQLLAQRRSELDMLA